MQHQQYQRDQLSIRFASITKHYEAMQHRITRSDEWGFDAYAWKNGGTSGISLSPIEEALWEFIRAENAVMYPQYPVGPYFVDFGNPIAKVAIECDGKQFHTDHRKDAIRQAEIEAIGWTVYRISGADCFTDTTERFDEDGRPVETLGYAQLFMRQICDNHPIRRGCLGRSNRGPVRLADLIAERLEVYRHGAL